MLITYTLDSHKSGKHLLVIGSIHGNELAWSLWIEKFFDSIKMGTIVLNTWKITCIPYANWEAYRKNIRYIDHNANRLFNQEGSTPEHIFVKQIQEEIKNCDFLLDLHTYHYGYGSFLFDDYESNETNILFDVIPVDQVILWWNNLYSGVKLGMDSTAYANSLWIPATTVECGFHTDENAVSIAYQSVINIGLTLWIIEWITPVTPIPKKRIRMETIVGKIDNAIFSKKWKHGDIIQPNEIIYRIWSEDFRNGQSKKVMVIPFPDATNKDEWFYIGTEV